MSRIEELRAAYAASTPGEWKPCRDHEDFDGEFIDIEPDERAAFDVRPFTSIRAESGAVVAAHDLFEFKSANAEFIALAHNLMPELLEAVAALEELLADRYLSDPINADRMHRARGAVEKLK